jgi:uncharacterized protein
MQVSHSTETDAGVELDIAGARIALLAQRAIHWPAERTLFVADVHLGKVETYRALGVPVPRGATGATLERLSRLLCATRAERLVVLGDLLHARQALEPASAVPLREWRRRHAALAVLLVRGNHDERAGDPPAELGFRIVEPSHRLGPFRLEHDTSSPVGPPGTPGAGEAAEVGDAGDAGEAADVADVVDVADVADVDDVAAAGYALGGHLHPTVRVGGRARESLRLRCFWFGARSAVLPAFGDFTGGAPFGRRDGDRVFGIAGDRVIEIPRGRAPRAAQRPV